MVRKKKQEASGCRLHSNLLILTGASWKGWHWIHSKKSADEQLHGRLGTQECNICCIRQLHARPARLTISTMAMLIRVYINTHTPSLRVLPLSDTLLLHGNRYCFECKPYKYSSEGYSCHEWHRIIKCLELEETHKDHGVQLLNDGIVTVCFIIKKLWL